MLVYHTKFHIYKYKKDFKIGKTALFSRIFLNLSTSFTLNPVRSIRFVDGMGWGHITNSADLRSYSSPLIENTSANPGFLP